MKSWLMGKAAAIVATVILLSLALARIGHLVVERQQHQAQAIRSVQQSFAGAQTLIGPVLQRHCVEEWEQVVGDGAQRRTETQAARSTLRSVPTRLQIDSSSETDLRYRGLFKVNGYAARVQMQVRWAPAELMELTPRRERAASRINCQAPTLWLATEDMRGLRSATLTGGVAAGPAPARTWPVAPGTAHGAYKQGLHAVLDDGFDAAGGVPAAPLNLTLTLDLVGTAQLSVVPAAGTTVWKHRADWPHPSFGGRFLPSQRTVHANGFEATWSLGALATSAPADVPRGVALCAGDVVSDKPCLDTLAVSFIDPVNPYSLSDRAIKYGLLFVVLTFTAVGLAEGLAAGRVRRVHPIQYALVGLALSLFFLLLLSLSEHLPFATAYAAASTACVVLLGFYARHMLGRPLDGWLFGGGMALLYGLLYLLLLREQTALVLGSLGLFAALALVMVLTRRVDWYRLGGSEARGEPRAA